MYTDEEILYHAFKISQTRDDQLMHAGWTKKIAKGSRIPSKDIRKEAITEIKDDSNFNKAWDTDNSGAIEDYAKQRIAYYIRNIPQNIHGALRNTPDDATPSDKLSKVANKWCEDVKVKVLDELHRKFNTPRNPYMTQIINDFYVSYIDNEFYKELWKHY